MEVSLQHMAQDQRNLSIVVFMICLCVRVCGNCSVVIVSPSLLFFPCSSRSNIILSFRYIRFVFHSVTSIRKSFGH